MDCTLLVNHFFAYIFLNMAKYIKNFSRKDFQQFAEKVRRKIDGWHRKDEAYSDAVNRIVLQREEIIGFLRKSRKWM